MGANAAHTGLTNLREIIPERGVAHWVMLADAQLGAMDAWRAFEAGERTAALTLMRGATDIEGSAGKAPVTPSHALPVREQLGDLYLLVGEPEAAISAYEATLSISPNLRRSIIGIARASGD